MQVKDVSIDFLGHSGFLITTPRGRKIAIDPYEPSTNVGKADIILITHSHFDHCHIPSITSMAQEKTIVVTTMDSQSKVTKLEKVDMQVIEVGDEMDFGELKIEAVPAYNMEKDFHPKKEGWLGYIIKIGTVVIYYAGDTDKIPEMEKLTGYSKHDNSFVVILPVAGNDVMNAYEAASAAELLKPDYAIPAHYGSGVSGTIEDANKFVELCKEKGINAQILEKI